MFWFVFFFFLRGLTCDKAGSQMQTCLVWVILDNPSIRWKTETNECLNGKAFKALTANPVLMLGSDIIESVASFSPNVATEIHIDVQQAQFQSCVILLLSYWAMKSDYGQTRPIIYAEYPRIQKCRCTSVSNYDPMTGCALITITFKWSRLLQEIIFFRIGLNKVTMCFTRRKKKNQINEKSRIRKCGGAAPTVMIDARTIIRVRMILIKKETYFRDFKWRGNSVWVLVLR